MTQSARSVTPAVIAQLLVFILLVPLLPLLISGRWSWWEAWTYAAIAILGFAVSRALAARRNPGLLAERARFLRHEDAQPWDRIMAPLLGIIGALAIVVIGMDELLGWSPAFSMPVKIVGLTLLLMGYVLGAYALIENRFFSGMVRLQTDRNHQVVTGGPYRWVRHPGYAGALISYIGTPFLLDSSWAFVPTALLMIVLIVRTRLEDRFLHANLDGYREFASRVRYRLLPWVW